jgi:hypothetical protein
MDMFGRTSILVRVHTSKMIEYVHILFFTKEYAYILFYYFDKYILFLENSTRVCMTDCTLFLIYDYIWCASLLLVRMNTYICF